MAKRTRKTTTRKKTDTAPRSAASRRVDRRQRPLARLARRLRPSAASARARTSGPRAFRPFAGRQPRGDARSARRRGPPDPRSGDLFHVPAALGQSPDRRSARARRHRVRRLLSTCRSRPARCVTCEIDPKRFRFAQSPVFFGRPVRRSASTVPLFREPLQWTPRFTRWSDLPRTFDDAENACSLPRPSHAVQGTEPIAPLLVDVAYDDMSGSDVTLAKTSLLNTYFRLNRSRRAGVRAVVVLIRAAAARYWPRTDPGVRDPAMERPWQIDKNIGQFRGDYENTPAEQPSRNVPAAMRDRITRMISIKSTTAKGTSS